MNHSFNKALYSVSQIITWSSTHLGICLSQRLVLNQSGLVRTRYWSWTGLDQSQDCGPRWSWSFVVLVLVPSKNGGPVLVLVLGPLKIQVFKDHGGPVGTSSGLVQQELNIYTMNEEKVPLIRGYQCSQGVYVFFLSIVSCIDMISVQIYKQSIYTALCNIKNGLELVLRPVVTSPRIYKDFSPQGPQSMVPVLQL